MERLSVGRNLRRAARFIFDQIHSEPSEAGSDHYHPSPQRDVGKSAREAAGVQLVLEGLECLPIIERPDSAQLNRTITDMQSYRNAMLERLNRRDDVS